MEKYVRFLIFNFNNNRTTIFSNKLSFKKNMIRALARATMKKIVVLMGIIINIIVSA